MVLPREKQQSPSQALWPQQCKREKPAELSSPLTQESQTDLCSLWCSWHTTGSSRLFTNSASNNEGSRTIKPTQRRNSRQHGVVGAVSLSYRLHKVSRYLWCAPSCITTARALPLLLPSSDLSRCNQAKPGPRLYSAWAELKSKSATDKKSELCGGLHNGSKKTAQWDTEELSTGSVFMNLNIYSTGKLYTQNVCSH